MAAKTWSRTVGDANWNTGANWNGGTVPATTDVVTFDGTSVLACTVNALGTFTGQIIVAAGYTGGTATITQNVAIPSTAAFSIAGGTWVQAAAITRTTFAVTGGTFTGGSQAITLSGTLTFSGGVLTMTSGTCTISTGSFTQTNSPTFNANGGVINFTGGTAATLTGPNCTFNRISFTKSAAFTIAAGTTCPLGTSPSSGLGGGSNFTVNGTVTWTDTFTCDATLVVSSTGVLTVSGTIRLSIEAGINFDAAASITANLPVTFTGNPTAVLTATAYTFATCTLSKTGQLTVAANTTLPLGSNVTSSTASAGGTAALIITGTVTVAGTWAHTGTITVTVTTGVVSGALTALSIGSSLTINTAANFPASVPVDFTGAADGTVTASGYTFPTCTLTKTAAGNFTIAASTTIPFGASPTLTAGIVTVTGTISMSGVVDANITSLVFGAAGVLSGAVTALQLEGTLNINATATFANGILLTLDGNNGCTVTATGRTFATPVTIFKSSGTGTVTLSSGVVFNLGVDPIVRCNNSTFWIQAGATVSFSGILDCDFDTGLNVSGTINGGCTGVIATSGITFAATAVFPAGLNVTWRAIGSNTCTFTGNNFATFGFLKRIGTANGLMLIVDSNTFTYFQDDECLVSHEVRWQASSTTTFSDAQPFRVYTIPAATISITSSTATNHIFVASNANAYINCDNLLVNNVTAPVSPVFYAGASSASGGDAPNWVFTANPRSPKFAKQNFRVMT